MFNTIKSIYYYSKTAAVSTYSALKEKVFYTRPVPSPSIPGKIYNIPSTPLIILGASAIGFAAGAVTIPLAVAALCLTPTLFKARENYISALVQKKTETLSEAEKKEIKEKLIAYKSKNEEIAKETKEFSDQLKPIFSKSMEDYKIVNPTFFRLSKDGKSFYMLGTYHPVPFEKLPDFVKDRFKELLDYPNAIMVGESNFGITNHSNAHAFKLLAKLIHLIVKNFFSLSSLIKGSIRPWYLDSELTPQVTYRIMLERAVASKNVLYEFLFLLSDFLKPGASILLHSLSSTKNLELLPHSDGMDHQCVRIIKPSQFVPLEDIQDQLNANGLSKLAKLKSKDISTILKLLETILDNISKQPITTLDELQRKCFELFKAYSEGNLEAIGKSKDSDSSYSKIDEKTRGELEKLGVAQNNEFSLIARNLNWFPKLIQLFQQYKTAFVFVGARHLTGETGLLNLFAQEGYKIERMIAEDKFLAEQYLIPLQDKSFNLPIQDIVPIMHAPSLLYYHQVKKRTGPCCGSGELVSVDITKNGKVRLA